VLGFSGILKFGKRFVSKNQIEESLNLEYKGAGALGKSDGKKGNIKRRICIGKFADFFIILMKYDFTFTG